MTTATTNRLLGARTRTTTPDWPEILAGGVAYLASFLLVAVLLPLIEDDAVAGILGLLLSGLMGLIALAAAVLIRIRGLSAFGVRRARARHLVVAAVLGVAAYVFLTTAAVGFQMLTGAAENVQSTYQAGASGGMLSIVFTLLAGAIVTPLGEEAFFRGVVANALLARYGAWIGIIVSAAIFAIAHGINIILPIAFVIGILTALLYRASGSIWPGVVLHGVNNAASLVVPLAITAIIGG